MTLEEAIIHAKQIAEMKRIEATSYENELDIGYCVKCAEEHEQIASWLTELKKIKEQKQGKWEFVGDNCFMCKACGYVADANWLRGWRVHTYDSEYPTACPKCGAKLGGDT